METTENRLREIREEIGLTQQELADKSGVSRVTISFIENQKYDCVKTDTLVKLADALGKPVTSVFF